MVWGPSATAQESMDDRRRRDVHRWIHIAVFPILTDLVDVKRGCQQCENVSQPSFSRIKWTDHWAIDPDPVLTSTASAKNGKTAILSQFQLTDCRRSPNWGQLHARDAIEHAPV